MKSTSSQSGVTLDRSILVTRGDERWDVARRSFNLTIDQEPNLIALPRSEQDVARAIRLALDAGLRVAPQRTSHGAFPLGPLDDTLLVRTDLMQGVEIDPDTRVARVAAGARWEDVVLLAADVGLAALHGTSPDVGVVGYTLGGGLSWYARKHGLACNHVTAVELVTAEGRLRRVDEDADRDLFWALRGGGGGNFGVVTALEFALEPTAEVYAGGLFFTPESAALALHTWRDWVASVPDELTSIARLIKFPDLPGVPDPLRGLALGEIGVVYVGDELEGAELIAPLRALGPKLDTVAATAPRDLLELHMDPREPIPYRFGHMLLDDLTHEAIEEAAGIAGPDSPLLTFEVRHTGGAAGRGGEGHGALERLPGSFATFSAGLVPDPESLAAVEFHLGLLTEVFGANRAGLYMNFTEHQTHPRQFFDTATLARLRAVKGDVDPDDVFRAPHPLTRVINA